MTKLSSKHSRTASEVERENGVPGGAEASYHSYAAMAHGLTARASIAHHRGRTASATTLAKRAHSYHTEALKFIGRARLKPDVESGLRNNHKIGMGVLHHIMHSTQESFSEGSEPHLTDKTILFESTFRVEESSVRVEHKKAMLLSAKAFKERTPEAHEAAEDAHFAILKSIPSSHRDWRFYSAMSSGHSYSRLAVRHNNKPMRRAVTREFSFAAEHALRHSLKDRSALSQYMPEGSS